MSSSSDPIRVASYTEFMAAGVLVLIIVAIVIVLLAMAWFVDAICLGFLLFPLGLVLMVWGQIGRRAISVEFGDCVTVRTLRRTVNYEKVAAWTWFDNNELNLYFETPTLHVWRIRATWKQVEQARRWLPPELWDVAPDDDELNEDELHSFRQMIYQDCAERHKS